jgi:hypothetical protein
MAHKSSSRGDATEVRDLLFKSDHPRAIDQHIDFFGGPTEPPDSANEDVSGEVILERPA